MPLQPADAPTDEELACRARQGCAASFEELVRRFQSPLLQFLRRLGAGADAEDVLQETFVRAFTNLHRYSERWRFATWLFTIARRTRINYGRRRGLPSCGGDPDTVASPAAGPFQEAVEAEDRQRLWGVAARVLSEDEQTALWLFYVEEMPAREIGRVLGRSWVAVKTMLFRARRRMLAAIQGTGSPQPRRRPAAAGL